MSAQHPLGRPRRDDPVPSVTTAARGSSHDLASRQRRYLLMMGIRVACLPLAVVSSGWLRVAFIIGAVVLPYIAVVIANAGSRPKPGTLVAVPEQRVIRALLPSHSRKDPISPR